MNKQQIKEAILGKEGCPKEETLLTQFATFHPDMEMVEFLLKGADINKSFNDRPLSWILQFCEDNLDTIVQLLFKYKYYSLHLNEIGIAIRQIRTQKGYLDVVCNLVLGITPNYKYEVGSFSLKDKEGLFLYTDGITEAQTKEEKLFAPERLKKTLNQKELNLSASLDLVQKNIQQFMKGAQQSDNITMMVIEFHK